MSTMVYQVVREDGQVPFKYGYVPCRNIFLTRGEAELFKVAVAAYNFRIVLLALGIEKYSKILNTQNDAEMPSKDSIKENN
jgi:hypothetical protein